MKFLSEGLPWKDYSRSQLALAALGAAGIFLLTEGIRVSCHELPFAAEAIPSNALIYAFHTDVMASFLANSFREKTQSVWIGYHGALSYIGSLGLALRHEPCFRYSRHPQRLKPMQQILEFLARHEGRVYLRTDAGGPYNQVKASLYDLCLGSGRPLVAVRHHVSRRLTMGQHHFPLPFAVIHSVCSAPITPDFLQSLPSKDAAIRLLQATIEEL